MKSSFLLLLLVVNTALARDPFLPAGVSPCPEETAALFAWRLQGVIGRPDNYQAWLSSSGTLRQRVRIEEQLAGSAWRVTHIDLQEVSLADGTQCLPPLTLRLKGEKKHVKDNPHPAVVDKPHQPGG